jgi:hypothetical protein
MMRGCVGSALSSYLLFGGLFPRPSPEGLPGFLLGALRGTGVLVIGLGALFFVTMAVSIACWLPASARAPPGANFLGGQREFHDSSNTVHGVITRSCFAPHK